LFFSWIWIRNSYIEFILFWKIEHPSCRLVYGRFLFFCKKLFILKYISSIIFHDNRCFSHNSVLSFIFLISLFVLMVDGWFIIARLSSLNPYSSQFGILKYWSENFSLNLVVIRHPYTKSHHIQVHITKNGLLKGSSLLISFHRFNHTFHIQICHIFNIFFLLANSNFCFSFSNYQTFLLFFAYL